MRALFRVPTLPVTPSRDHRRMAICDDCKQDMTTASGCTLPTLVLDDKTHDRIRYGNEWRHLGPPSKRRCHDCGVQPGALHHLGCDWEECPGCGDQLISCGCWTDGDDDCDDEVRW